MKAIYLALIGLVLMFIVGCSGNTETPAGAVVADIEEAPIEAPEAEEAVEETAPEPAKEEIKEIPKIEKDDGCNTIADQAKKDACYINKGMETGDLSYCDRTSNPSDCQAMVKSVSGGLVI